MKKIFIAGILLLFSSVVSAQDIDLLWKARALKAGEKLEELKHAFKKKDTKKLRMDIMVETAYASIITLSDITVKKTPQTVTYHLILNYGDDGFLDVVYTYDAKTYEYLGARIDKLPTNRSILLLNIAKADNVFAVGNVLDNKEPAIFFSKRDPFAAFAADVGQ